MHELHRTDFHVLSFDAGRGVLWYRRTKAKYHTVQDFFEDIAEVNRVAVDVPDGKVGLVIDSRDSMGRNDDDFETTARKAIEEMVLRFPKIAFLMKTQVGVLQSQRLLPDEFADIVYVTSDEAAAFAFAETAK